MKAFFAIVYELCLDGDGVAKDDPLFETSYIGQAGRYSSSPEEAMEMRWAEHKQTAKNDPKECGLKWALQKYGPEAFSKRVICFLKFEKRCLEALEWMDAVEIEEIDCRGGVMQDIDPPVAVFHTFNLTNGGQNNARGRFESLIATEKRVWKRFQEKVLELVAETGTCRCHKNTKSKCGYYIGQALYKIHWKRHFLLGVEDVAEREKFLEDLPGWSWTIFEDADADSWSDFQREILAHIEEFGTAYIQAKYVSPSGYPLGSKAAELRNRGQFLRGEKAQERVDWLNTLPGWTWNAKKCEEYLQCISAASSKAKKDPEKNEAFVKKLLETHKRKREERWATLDGAELADAKRRFEWAQNGAAKAKEKRKAKREAKREAKARGEAPEPKKPPKPKTESRVREYEKVKADLAALRATLVPKAQKDQVPRYRKDGTVAKAHQILRERSVDAGV